MSFDVHGRRARLIAIDARAAVRPELGGVERWARELCARLPYRVHAPRPRLAHRAGHAWEQLALPVLSARDDVLLCPANLAPVAARNVVVILHDAAPLRHPGWYSPAYATWQKALLPLIARRARRVITVSPFSRDELRELLGVEAEVVYGGVEERFRAAEPVRRERPYVLCVASQTARKNLGGADARGGRARARRRRRGRRGRPPAAVRGRGRAWTAWCCSATSPTGSCPASTPAPRPSSCPRSTRASACPCWRRWRAGPRSSPPTRPRSRTPAAAPRGSPSRSRRRSATRSRACCATPRERRRLAALGRERARGFTWERTAREVDAVCRAAASRHLRAPGRQAVATSRRS